MATERRDGPTPNGGAYSIAHFLRDGQPVEKERATEVRIIEYSEDGEELMRTRGTLPKHDG